MRVSQTVRAGTMMSRRLAFVAGIPLAGGALIAYGPFLLARSRVPVIFNEADLDRDGHVSWTEAGYIADRGTRLVVLDGRQCTEYFAFKDGMPIKVVCA